MSPPRLQLAHLPTPLRLAANTSAALKVSVWIKNDDATSGAAAGNKIRKLEYLLADAERQGADTVITCGGVQSNHVRATALCSVQRGLSCVALLRVPTLESDADGRGVSRTEAGVALSGNLLLGHMLGAELRLITPQTYARRAEVMAALATELSLHGRKPYVIPEGGSNGLGAFGYIEAMGEVAEQADAPFDVAIVACGSGGTAAGMALGAAKYGGVRRVVAVAVCNDESYFEAGIRRIIAEAKAIDHSLPEPVSWRVEARFKGPAYARASRAQRVSIVRAARADGLVLDPVYSGKAFHALERLCHSGEIDAQRVLFVHTGGLPGLLAQAASFESGA